MKLDVDGGSSVDRSLHRACNNSGTCEVLPLPLLGGSSNIQQWCLTVYYFIPYNE